MSKLAEWRAQVAADFMELLESPEITEHMRSWFVSNVEGLAEVYEEREAFRLQSGLPSNEEDVRKSAMLSQWYVTVYEWGGTEEELREQLRVWQKEEL